MRVLDLFSGIGESELRDAGRLEAERCGSSIWPISQSDWWEFEPDVGRVAHGVPARVDRLKALGNALVPQVPEIIGRAIMSYASAKGVEQ
jgi:site-specific DNA-cytosine methylase